MTRDEKNRRLAEWIYGDVFCKCMTTEDGRSIHGYCQDNSGFENLQENGSCWSCRKRPMHYDFYASEDASALLLEKILGEDCHVVMAQLVTVVWGSRRYELNQEGTRYVLAADRDRRTAIAEGALLQAIATERGKEERS